MDSIQHLLCINDKETGKNLRTAIQESEYTTSDVAKFLGVTERTIQYWMNGERLPSLSNMVYLSALLGIDMRELIILNEDVKMAFSDDTVRDIIDNEKNKDNNPIPYLYYIRKLFPIKNLEEFLLYYPLFDKELLDDFFYRINGNIGFDSHYVLEQINYLYTHIEDKEQRNKLDKYVHKYLSFPRKVSQNESVSLDDFLC